LIRARAPIVFPLRLYQLVVVCFADPIFFAKDALFLNIGYFTPFFPLFHFLPSTFPTLKQASHIVA